MKDQGHLGPPLTNDFEESAAGQKAEGPKRHPCLSRQRNATQGCRVADVLEKYGDTQPQLYPPRPYRHPAVKKELR